MQFSCAPIQSVKSISQRALSAYWHRLASGRIFPTIEEFNPGPRLHDPKQLVFWNIEVNNGQRFFRALYQGTNVAEVFNSSWAGKLMEEVAPEALKAFTLDAAHECAESGCAVYTVLTTADANGHGVDCERLLLPLGEGDKAKQIVASLQLISLTGDFARKTVLGSFEKTSHVSFAGRIHFRGQPETEPNFFNTEPLISIST